MPPPSYEPGSWTQGQLMSYYLPWITLTVMLIYNKLLGGVCLFASQSKSFSALERLGFMPSLYQTKQFLILLPSQFMRVECLLVTLVSGTRYKRSSNLEKYQLKGNSRNNCVNLTADLHAPVCDTCAAKCSVRIIYS